MLKFGFIGIIGLRPHEKFMGLATALMLLCTSDAFARDVFLNGTDISSAKNQKLKNVTVQIDANGNVYIEGKHYQVHDESAYLPLSSYIQGIPQPQNTAPLTLPSHNGKPITVQPGNGQPAAAMQQNGQLNLDKAGSKVAPVTAEAMTDSPASDNPPGEVSDRTDGEATAH